MFEEVPRGRRGLAGLSARRIVLGPFAIGGGVLLATVGGSVAVAATVITASTIHTSDLPPKPAQRPAVVSSPAHSSHSVTGRSPAAGRSASTAGISSGGPVTLALIPPASDPGQRSPSAATPSGSASPTKTGPVGSATPTGSASTSPSGPAGNALIYVNGYDQTSHRLSFQFAVVQRGAGPYGSDLYSVNSPERFNATIAADITITSGGQLCPPAGSSCTAAQLIAAASKGFYANAAIDPSAAVQSILELDNVPAPYAGPITTSTLQPSPALSGSPQPSPTVTPTG